MRGIHICAICCFFLSIADALRVADPATAQFAYVSVLASVTPNMSQGMQKYYDDMARIADELSMAGSKFPYVILSNIPDIHRSVEARPNIRFEALGPWLEFPCKGTPANNIYGPFQSVATKWKTEAIWQKLHIWNLTAYKRVLYLDLDVSINSNPDHLFHAAMPRGGVAGQRDDELCLGHGFDLEADVPIVGFRAADARRCTARSAIRSRGFISRIWRQGRLVGTWPPSESKTKGFNAGVLLLEPNPRIISDLHIYYRDRMHESCEEIVLLGNEQPIIAQMFAERNLLGLLSLEEVSFDHCIDVYHRRKFLSKTMLPAISHHAMEKYVTKHFADFVKITLPIIEILTCVRERKASKQREEVQKTSELKILTVANLEREYLPLSSAIARYYNTNFEVLGLGEQYYGLLFKLDKLSSRLAELSTMSNETHDIVVMFVDAYDVLPVADSQEILAKFNNFTCNGLACDIVFSSDHCAMGQPVKAFATRVANKFAKDLYCHKVPGLRCQGMEKGTLRNSGAYIGKVGPMLDLVQRMQRLYQKVKNHTSAGSDQLLLNNIDLSGMRTAMDFHSSIFFTWSFGTFKEMACFSKLDTLSDKWTKGLTYSQGRLQFEHTGVMPSVVHAIMHRRMKLLEDTIRDSLNVSIPASVNEIGTRKFANEAMGDVMEVAHKGSHLMPVDSRTC